MDSRQAMWLIQALETHADATVWAAAYAGVPSTAHVKTRSAIADEALSAWHERVAKKNAERVALEKENDAVRAANWRNGL